MSLRLAAVAGTALLASVAHAQSLGSSFTYQGQLTEAGLPALGLYDLQVCLYDAPSGGSELACAPDLDDVPVEDGAFTVALDFGDALFVGQQRWIELRIRDGASTGGYTILLPRQLVRPAPEALRANRADSATTAATATSADTANSATTAESAPWTGLTGVPAGFADGVDDDSGGTVTEITAGTGLEGGPITTSGTIGIADGGVGAAQIAPGAVGTDQIADGSIGAPDIDNTQVQARVFGTCDPGFYVRGINPDGSVICSPLVNQNRFFSIGNPFVGGGPGVGNLPSIAIGSDGNPIISHKNYTNGPLALFVEHCSSPLCSGNITQTIIDSTDNVGSYSSLAIGNDGLPIISYEDFTAGALKVAKCNDIACATPATITVVDDPANEVGEWTSMAIGTDGLPVIAYHDKTAGTLKVAKCVNADCTGSAIITVVDGDPANDVGQTLSLAIGNDGFPVIAYYDATASALKVAKCVATDCTGTATITIVDAGSRGEYPSIAIGDDGFPIISYFTGIALKVAKCTDVACTAPPVLTVVDTRPNSQVGQWTSIEIGPEGRPAIAYSSNTGGAVDPAFVRCAMPDCSGPGNQVAVLRTTDAQDGSQTSLALRPDGAPIIAHWRFEPGTLGVVVCGALGCQ